MNLRFSAAVLLILSAACTPSVAPFSAAHIDKSTAGTSAYPVPLDANRIGTYPGRVKSGAGYFYDEVLEYRVWLHPDRGAPPLAGKSDYFAAFAQYERAMDFSKSAPGAEEPLALLRQVEWINEPEPGKYVAEKGERLTEWQVKWLEGAKRGPHSISEFLAAPRARRE